MLERVYKIKMDEGEFKLLTASAVETERKDEKCNYTLWRKMDWGKIMVTSTNL
jgi:hypothetical protein